MPTVKFGHKDEPGFELHQGDNLIAVRTYSTRSLRAGPVVSAAMENLDDAELLLVFPEVGVEVYRVPTDSNRKAVNERKRDLRMAADIRFAGGVLVEPQTGEPVLYTENLFLKFVDEADPENCRQVIQEAGLQIKEALTYATNAYFVAAPEGTGQQVFEIALRLLERDDVEYCHPELVRRRQPKSIFPQQWHLKTTAINGVTVSASANVEAAHQTAQGEGITIAIIDDGVDIDHPELFGSAKIVAPRDATYGTSDPRPKDPHPRPEYAENHGTACAGVACAAGQQGASGVAPQARLMPIRLASGLGSMQEANAFRWAVDNGADVISCSWGPQDGRWYDLADPIHNQFSPLPASTKLAIDYATTNGRKGKGCIVLFAAGNGNESVDNDGYASYEKVIAVAACNDRSKRSVYSDFGRAVWCAFPSSDFEHAPFNHPAPLTSGIWTTDRLSNKGYNPGTFLEGDPQGHYTNSFGGTSSACPGAAGVAALILSVNPDLRSQEVRDILRRACERIDPQGGQYDENGHSKLYGYGRLNAELAVKLAKPQPVQNLVIRRSFNQPLPDLQTIVVALEVGESTPVTALSVAIEIEHTYIGDLLVTLIPPPEMGQGNIILHNRLGGATRNLKRTYTSVDRPALLNFKGKSVKGTWQLEVRDSAFRDVGVLVSFGLELAFG